MNLINKMWFVTIAYMLYAILTSYGFYALYTIIVDKKSTTFAQILCVLVWSVFIISFIFWTIAYIKQMIDLITKNDGL
jgi:predicted PurR-regulated permease PerM